MIGNGQPLSHFGAMVSLSIENAKVMEGITFSWDKRFTLAGSGVANIVIDTTNVDANKFAVILPIAFSAVNGGPINVDLYENLDIDADGTLWQGINRNHRIATVPQTIVRLNPTINDPGTKMPPEFMIPSDGIPASASFGGQTKDDLVFNSKTTKYNLKVTNTDITLAHLSFAMSILKYQ